ncbi:MAG: hypothetical protein WC702_04155 [Patescibacteria group bacterium]|jgi:hypothetical protein
MTAMDNGNNQGFLKPEEKQFQTFYKREVWWLEHEVLLKKIGLGLFMAFDAVLICFAGWLFLDAYVISRAEESQAVAALAVSGQTELRNFSLSVAADPLSVSEAVAVASGDDKNYDLYAKVTNNNSDWYATFKYAFKFQGGETAEAEGFVLPGESRPLITFKASGTRPAAADLVLRQIEWHRVDSRSVADYPAWLSEHAIQINDQTFNRGDDVTSPTVSFSVKNNTAYSYWQPSFLVMLWRGSTLGGLMRITTSGLASGEERTLSGRWIGAVPAVSQVEVVQETNFFDPQVYSSLKGIQSGDVRTEIETR